MPHNHSPDAKQIAVSNLPTDYFKQGQYIGGFGIPDGAIQVTKEAIADNSTVIVYTVTTGKTFYLCSYTLTATNSGAMTNNARLFVRNGGDVVQYHMELMFVLQPQCIRASMAFPVPVEIPAEYDVVVQSQLTDLKVRAFIFGYEI